MEYCRDCKFFVPVFFQLGRCRRQFSPEAKMHSDSEKSEIFVHPTFYCQQYEKPADIKEEHL